jgi:lipoprotein-anchoring transpeptidase ErfK/SrfK
MWKKLASDKIWIPLRLAAFAIGAVMLVQGVPDLVSARIGQQTGSDPAIAASLDGPQAGAEAAAEPTAAPPTIRASLSSVQVRSELDIPHWLRPGEYAWNDEGVPAGPSVIVVNIRARVLSVYRGGVEIGRSSLIYGADNKPTPTGEFPSLEKDADHVSNLYDAPMPHMLRLTWDGVAIHGSPELRDDLATRGCVGLPREFAALLFDVVGVGDRVIVWDGVTPS